MRTTTFIFLFLLTISSHAAEKLTAPQLISLAQSNSPTLKDAITSTFTTQELKEGTAWAGKGHDFFFAVASATSPELFIDGAPGPKMQSLGDQWYATARI